MHLPEYVTLICAWCGRLLRRGRGGIVAYAICAACAEELEVPR